MNNYLVDIQLPSQGKLYKFPMPNGVIQIAPLRGEHEELLASMNDHNQMSILRRLTQLLSKLPQGMQIADLLITDWTALLLNVFAISYSPTIPLAPVCSLCKNKDNIILKFSELSCRKGDEIENFVEPFTTKPLPKSSDVVTFHMLRVSHQEEIENYAQQQSRKSRNVAMLGDPTNTYTMCIHIETINGQDVPLLEKMAWYKNLLMHDINFLRASFEAKDTGYDLRPTFTCTKCGEVYRVSIPIDPSFFRSIAT